LLLAPLNQTPELLGLNLVEARRVFREIRAAANLSLKIS
jgi:hypothetical protein